MKPPYDQLLTNPVLKANYHTNSRHQGFMVPVFSLPPPLGLRVKKHTGCGRPILRG